MKQKYLFLKVFVALLFTGLVGQSTFAQTWDAPTYTGEVPTSGTAYYIYNVGADAFLNRGGEWGTEAVVSSKPRVNASSSFSSWTCVDASGEWTFQYTNAGSPASGHYLFQITDGGGWIFTDNSSANTWNILETDATEHIHSIQVPSTASYYNAAQFLGAQTVSHTTNRGVTVSVRYTESASDHTQWKFVSQDSYDLYQAKVDLDRYLTYADAIGGIDLTSYITAYNSDVLATIETATSDLITAISPTDVSSSITNPSFETNDFTGWTNSYFVTQNNDPNGTGMTKDGTYYIEKYVNSGSTLAANTITQTITGLTNGLYQLRASGHAVQQNGLNPISSGAYIQGGSKSTEIIEGDDYIVDMIEVSAGSLTIGYALSGTITANWIGFDNFELYYMGVSSVASSDATLSDLQISEGALTPSFSAGTTSYTVTLPSSATTVDVNATRNHTAATFTIDGNLAADGVDQAVALTAGSGTATIEVTAEDGTTIETYTVTFVGVSSTLKHSYPFNDGTADDIIAEANGTANGSALAIANGAATVSGSTSSTSGYIALPGDTIDMYTYSAVTIEAYLKADNTNGSYTMLAHFGNNVGGSKSFWFQPTISGTASRAAVNNTSPVASSGTELNDGAYHHVVATLTSTDLSYYLDGELAASVTTGGTNYIATIDSAVANLFKGPDGWGDNNYNASLYKFNIYEGQLASSEIAANAASFVDKAHDASLSDITVGGTSVDGFSTSTYTYEVQVAEGDPVPTVVGTNTDGNASNLVTDASAIPGSTVITCTAEDGETMLTYTINFVTISSDATLSGITLSDGTLIPTFDAATTSYVVSTTSGVTSVSVSATTTSGAATINSGTGDIAVSGTGSTSIEVEAEDGTILTYTIAFKEECFSPMYDDNMITDPTMTSLSNFGGWGSDKGVNTDFDFTYCGATSVFVGAAAGTASVDVVVNSGFSAGNTYLATAKLYATSGTFNFGAYDVDANPYEVYSSTTGSWETMELLFTVGASYNSGACGLYFNNWSQDGSGGYIDNWELYDVTEATLTSLTGNGFSVPDFAASTLSYDFYVPLGEGIPTIEAVTADGTASAVVTQATTLPGTATVVVTGPNGKELTYTVNISEYVPTYNELVKQNQTLVYPTVSNGSFTVRTNGEESLITVYDLSGKVVLQQKGTSTEQQVSVEKAGMYMFKVECDGEVNVFKVFKN